MKESVKSVDTLGRQILGIRGTNSMNEIIDGLWISDRQSAIESSTSKFDIVITVCQDSIEDNVGCEYYFFNLADGEVDRYGGECTYDLFEDIVDVIRDTWRDNDNVLVHCHAGQSRSVTTSAAAIAVERDIRHLDALDLIRSERDIHPSEKLFEFMKQYVITHRGTY